MERISGMWRVNGGQMIWSAEHRGEAEGSIDRSIWRWSDQQGKQTIGAEEVLGTEQQDEEWHRQTAADHHLGDGCWFVISPKEPDQNVMIRVFWSVNKMLFENDTHFWVDFPQIFAKMFCFLKSDSLGIIKNKNQISFEGIPTYICPPSLCVTHLASSKTFPKDPSGNFSGFSVRYPEFAAPSLG